MVAVLAPSAPSDTSVSSTLRKMKPPSDRSRASRILSICSMIMFAASPVDTYCVSEKSVYPNGSVVNFSITRKYSRQPAMIAADSGSPVGRSAGYDSTTVGEGDGLGPGDGDGEGEGVSDGLSDDDTAVGVDGPAAPSGYTTSLDLTSA